MSYAQYARDNRTPKRLVMGHTLSLLLHMPFFFFLSNFCVLSWMKNLTKKNYIHMLCNHKFIYIFVRSFTFGGEDKILNIEICCALSSPEVIWFFIDVSKGLTIL